MRNISLWLCLFIALSGCAGSISSTRTKFLLSTNGVLKIADQSWEKLTELKCTRNLIEELRPQVESNANAALNSAYCFTKLIELETNSSQRLADAKQGLKIAKSLAEQNQSNAVPQYLVALHTGYVAENDVLHGLSLVTEIELAAKNAAAIDPAIDSAGPERVLGELYLQAPGPPVSIGDADAATSHFKRAAALAPLSIDNQLGLVEALIADDELDAACLATHTLFNKFPQPAAQKPAWEKGLKLLERLCKLQK